VCFPNFSAVGFSLIYFSIRVTFSSVSIIHCGYGYTLYHPLRIATRAFQQAASLRTPLLTLRVHSLQLSCTHSGLKEKQRKALGFP